MGGDFSFAVEGIHLIKIDLNKKILQNCKVYIIYVNVNLCKLFKASICFGIKHFNCN